mgnify:CR=1 FL=1|jgi:hypothetical protein
MIQSAGTSCACSAGGATAALLSAAGCALLGRSETPLGASWLAPSEPICPSEAEVLVTPLEDRWSTWDDPSCSGACRAPSCGGGELPCCLKGGVPNATLGTTWCRDDAMPGSSEPPGHDDYATRLPQALASL